MPTAKVEHVRGTSYLPAATSLTAVPPAAGQLAQLGRGLPSTDGVVAELERIEAAVRGFYSQEPDEVMRATSAYSARLTELANHIVRVEGTQRAYKSLRTMQIDRLLKELQFQFQLHSRMVELRRQDLELLR